MQDLIPALSASGLLGAIFGVFITQMLNFFLQEKIHRKNRVAAEMCDSAMDFFSRTNYLMHLIRRVIENRHAYSFQGKMAKYSSREKYWKEQDKISADMKMAYFELDFLYGDKCSTEYRSLFTSLFRLLHEAKEIILELDDVDFTDPNNKKVLSLKEKHHSCLIIHRQLKIHFQEDLHIDAGDSEHIEETYY